MMRIKLRHCSLFAGSLLLAACGDDSSANPDTDASSSSGGAETSGGPTDPTIDPDSSSSDAPTTSPETTVDSSGSESSSSDGGGTCIIPTTILADPSFEAGANASEWGEASSAFQTPLCDAGCGGPEAQDGSWYVWLGGSSQGDVGGVSQEVTIGKADSLELSFYFQYGLEGNGSDVFQLQIDGDVLWEVTNADVADYADWTLVTIDVSAYADGGDHDIDFTGNASPNANLFLDNIQLETCGTGAAITESDTVDAAMSGGDTDSTTDTGGMLTCEDIGNTVPVAQAGNNGGAGDDVAGSCNIGGGDGAGADVGYTWTAPADGTYRFDTLGSPLDTVLYILDTCDSGGTELACNDDSGGTFQSLLTLPLTAGQTITIVVDGWSSADVDDFTLNINQVSCDPPIDLGNNEPVNQDGDNTGAGDDVSASCGGVGGEDVVYTWQAPDAGIYSISASSLVLAPVVSAYSGTCGDPGSELGCAADNNLAAFNVVVAADQQISIVVDGATADDIGAYELAITQTGVLSGDCCAADDSAGCEDATITQCTCGVDVSGFAGPTPIDPADCCTGDWTAECAAVADAACDAGCDAGVDGGTCCVGDSGVGGCDVPEVQDCVCAFDSFCCDTEWDAECVAKGQLFCSAQCA